MAPGPANNGKVGLSFPVQLGEHFAPLQLQSLTVTLVPRSLCATAYKKEATVVDETGLCARGEDWKGVCEVRWGGSHCPTLGGRIW